ncbi:hypothetical protein BDW74DRAFT_180990 [Aspergillus multicolor]|uniref:DUF3176 domain-containing protein n=1 Tax=Aspergillus multicolor TaxID=41759 RepID=UPI003CCDA67D
MSRNSKNDQTDGRESEYKLLPRNLSPPPPVELATVKSKSLTRQMLDTWFYGILATSFIVACFMGTIATLKVYSSKPAPNFAYGLTLNAIVSLLATASNSSLPLVIAECIGQLKWLRFHDAKKRKLSGLQVFDNASQGPLGSLMLKWRHRGQSVVLLGAFITILALTFDPLIQQILTYPIQGNKW